MIDGRSSQSSAGRVSCCILQRKVREERTCHPGAKGFSSAFANEGYRQRTIPSLVLEGEVFTAAFGMINADKVASCC